MSDDSIIIHGESYKNGYDLSIEPWGGGYLREDILNKSLNDIFKIFEEENDSMPKDISLFIDDPHWYGYRYGITGIDHKFLEKIGNLKELVLPDSLKRIRMTNKLKDLLIGNKVLIRGTFDSFAEKLATDLKLHFRHVDLIIARCYDEEHYESVIITLQFRRDGTVQLEEAISTPGSSNSHSFGVERYQDLPKDFWKTMSAEDVASMYGSWVHDKIIAEGKLADFIEKARTHKPYTGKN